MIRVKKLVNGKEVGTIVVEGNGIIQQDNFDINDYLTVPNSTIEEQLRRLLTSTGNYQSLYKQGSGYVEIA